jgi:hypothetical protein
VFGSALDGHGIWETLIGCFPSRARPSARSTHQSALAGILLAAAACRVAIGRDPDVTTVSRLDVMRAVGERHAEPARAGRSGRCICEDPDFRAALAAAYGKGRPAERPTIG